MKKLIVLVIAVVLLSSAGCGTKKSESLNKPVENLEGFTNTKYNAETDQQSFFQEVSGIAKTDDGYIINCFDYLYFMDGKSTEITELCSNINCKHNDESCDAFIDGGTYLQYNDNALYYVCYSGVAELYKRSLDGSKVERICSLNTSDYYPVISVHRGYCYYSVMLNDKSAALFRVELKKDAQPEMIYKLEESDADIVRIKGYGDGVMFISSFEADRKYTDYKFNLMYYDSDKDAIFLVKEDINGDYAVADDKVYYTYQDGIYCYDVKTKTDELFIKTEANSFMSYDGRYLYIDDKFSAFGIYYEEAEDGGYIYYSGYDDEEGTRITEEEYNNRPAQLLTVVSLEGNVVDVIDYRDSFLLYGDEAYLFKFTSDGIAAFDKSQIGTKEREWKEFKLNKYDSF